MKSVGEMVCKRRVTRWTTALRVGVGLRGKPRGARPGKTTDNTDPTDKRKTGGADERREIETCGTPFFLSVLSE